MENFCNLYSVKFISKDIINKRLIRGREELNSEYFVLTSTKLGIILA